MPRRNATSHLWKARAVARPCEGLAYGLHDTLWQPRGAAPLVQIRFPFMPARKAPSKPASRRPASTGARARPAAPPRKKPRSVREAAVAPAAPLNANQKRYLRSLAHDLKAVILIGQKGVTEAVLKELDIALAHHELVKVRLADDDRESRMQSIERIAGETRADVVQTIGRVACFYRRNPERAQFTLPK